MSLDLFGPGNASNSVTAEPSFSTSWAALDTFFKDCSSPTADDGTDITADFLNLVLTNLRAVARANGNKLDGATPVLADANVAGQVVAAIQHLIQRGRANFAVTTGAANALVASPALAPAELIDGLLLVLSVPTANTAQTVTLNVSGLGAKAVVHPDGSLPIIGEVVGKILVVYDAGSDKFVLFPTKKYIDSLSPKGASSAAAFTPNLVSTDTALSPSYTTSQTLALPLGTTWIQAQAANSLRNTSSTITNTLTYLTLTGSDGSSVDGPYIGSQTASNIQVPLPVSGIWNGLNPAVTYTLNLRSTKGVAAGPVNILDARISALYGV